MNHKEIAKRILNHDFDHDDRQDIEQEIDILFERKGIEIKITEALITAVQLSLQNEIERENSILRDIKSAMIMHDFSISQDEMWEIFMKECEKRNYHPGQFAEDIFIDIAEDIGYIGKIV